MTPQEIRRIVIETLGEAAPEADLTRLNPARPLRDQIDLDSYDFLNLIVALHDKLAVDIPETDYDQLATLDSTVAYLAAHTP